jgi:hypothetical protein
MTAQLEHVMLVKNVLDQAVVFAQMQTQRFRRYNASGVLSAMLQYCQAIH